MSPNQLFAQALPLEHPWKVNESQFEGEPKRLKIEVGLEEDTRSLPCPKCGEQGAIHDRKERKWKHLNFWQYETELSALVPRVKCEKCGVHLVAVPWARPGSGFTLLFEAMVLLLAGEMPVSEVARMVGEYDTRLWRIIRHYVDKAHAKSQWKGLSRVAVDETSRKKGHRYVTNFVDLDSGKLIFMTEGKDASTVGAFASQLIEHQSSAEAIEEVAMDMSKAFQSGVEAYLPNAKKVFDRYHVMALAGEALDAVRKEVALEVGGLEKGALWALRGNASRLGEEKLEQRERLCREHKKLGRAMALKEFLADTWRYAEREDAREHLDAVISWASRCRLEPFKKLARTLRKHSDGILDYYHHWTTSAVIEAIYGKLQLARRRARGYRNWENFRAIAYWIAGDLKLTASLPDPIPQPF